MLFSILIPAYKKKFLKECIDSIFSQTYQDFEIIVVNDASPENLDTIIKIYEDQRLHYYVNSANCGAINVVDNWNKCLNYAKGKYVMCIGDDDCLLPNCLEDYAKLIKKYPNLGVYHGWTEIIDEFSRFKNVSAPRVEFETVYSLIWNRWNGRSKQYIGDFIFNRQILISKGGFYKLPLAWASDDITAAMMAEETGVANTQTIVFQYRESNMTISSSNYTKEKIEAIMLEQKWYENFLEKPVSCDIDQKYKVSIQKSLSYHFIKKKYIYITKGLKNNKRDFFYWFSQSKKYGLTKAIIVYSLLKSLI